MGENGQLLKKKFFVTHGARHFSFAQDACFLTHSQQLFLPYKPFLPSRKQIISYIFISVLCAVGKGSVFSKQCEWICWHSQTVPLVLASKVRSNLGPVFQHCYTHVGLNYLYQWRGQLSPALTWRLLTAFETYRIDI